MKVDLSDGFFRIVLRPAHIPKLAILFPSKLNLKTSVALPLVHPMRWTNLSPVFRCATETIVNLADRNLKNSKLPPRYKLDGLATLIDKYLGTMNSGY